MSLLREHAMQHVWVSPLQDYQHKLKPTRVSPRGGAYKEVKVMWESVPLPNYNDPLDTRKFHAYPLGQLPPMRFALAMEKRTWYRLDQLSMLCDTVIDVYADNGCLIQNQNAYLYHNRDNNLILAVDANVQGIGVEIVRTPYGEDITTPYTLDRHGLTIRFYHNAIIENKLWADLAPVVTQPLTEVSQPIRNVSDFNTFKKSVDNVKNKYQSKGIGVYFLDGYLIDEPVGFKSTYTGKTLCYRFDGTVKEVRNFPIATTGSFVSKLDTRKNKYLLISDRKNKYMDYFDDCDFYLMGVDENQILSGVKIDVYGDTVLRQVTHTAWALDQSEVVRLSQLHYGLKKVDLATIRAVVRQGGVIRDAGLQANRIEELYHLSNEQIKEAMLGVNSTVPFWKAVELENSNYMKMVSSREFTIPESVIEDGYGYNAMTRAVAKTNVVRDVNGEFLVDGGFCIPSDSKKPNATLARTMRSFTWYDKDGYYLGYQNDQSLNSRVAVGLAFKDKAAKLEVISGAVSLNLSDNGTVTDKAVVVDPFYGFFGYRCYVCGITNGVPDHKWVDVTDSNLYTYVDDGVNPPSINWNYTLLNAANYYPAVRIASKVNFYTPSYSTSAFTGCYETSLSRLQDSRLMVLGVPPGHVDVFLNGECLIPELDYYYRGSGKVVVVKKPTTDIDKTQLVVRAYGYMNPRTNKPYVSRVDGFVKNGVLTVNDEFDVHHDRDLRIILKGRLMRADEVQFAEDEINPNGPFHLDGMSFALLDYQPLLEPFAESKTIPAIVKAEETDELIKAYLSTHLEPMRPIDEYITPKRHTLYSPICSVFTQMMLNGKLTDDMIDIESTDQTIIDMYGTLVKQYADYDPIVQGYDSSYVYVCPHALNYNPTITSKQFAFLVRVNRIWLNGVLDLSNNYRIKVGT